MYEFHVDAMADGEPGIMHVSLQVYVGDGDISFPEVVYSHAFAYTVDDITMAASRQLRDLLVAAAEQL